MFQAYLKLPSPLSCPGSRPGSGSTRLRNGTASWPARAKDRRRYKPAEVTGIGRIPNTRHSRPRLRPKRHPQKNGLCAFSSATVVSGPCPGQSSVSGGRVRICSRTFCRAKSHDWFPRPIEPAKIASPTMATCGASSGQLPMM